MILLFGGTTEGKDVAELLSIMKLDFIYSTKTKCTFVPPEGSLYRFGDLDARRISDYISKNSIDLIIDAAHPFAENLHNNIAQAAKDTDTKAIRFIRKFPPRQHKNVTYKDSIDEIIEHLNRSHLHRNILALTGANTLYKYKKFSDVKVVYYRTLNSIESIAKAIAIGIPENRLFTLDKRETVESVCDIISSTRADAIITKENGFNGYMEEKIEAVNRKNIDLFVVKRPKIDDIFITINQITGLKHYLEVMYTRIKDEDNLRTGYSTGACATAAAKAAAISLMEQREVQNTDITLPNGANVRFKTLYSHFEFDTAVCTVLKDGGDDPDITHGCEIGCKTLISLNQGEFIAAGKGIGKVTLPGLSVPPEGDAINPVPRKMILSELGIIRKEHQFKQGLIAKIFVPEGEKIAKKTFNPRIGIVNGISIIGTTGIVKPYSSEAFTASIKQNIDVASANNENHVILNSGGRSERYLKAIFSNYKDIAFVQFGNYIGDTLGFINRNINITKVTLGIMLGKAVKLAEGHLDTHSKKVVMNRDFLSAIAESCGLHKTKVSRINSINMASELTDIEPFNSSSPFYNRIIELCHLHCINVLSNSIQLNIVLMNSTGNYIMKYDEIL